MQYRKLVCSLFFLSVICKWFRINGVVYIAVVLSSMLYRSLPECNSPRRQMIIDLWKTANSTLMIWPDKCEGSLPPRPYLYHSLWIDGTAEVPYFFITYVCVTWGICINHSMSYGICYNWSSPEIGTVSPQVTGAYTNDWKRAKLLVNNTDQTASDLSRTDGGNSRVFSALKSYQRDTLYNIFTGI